MFGLCKHRYLLATRSQSSKLNFRHTHSLTHLVSLYLACPPSSPNMFHLKFTQGGFLDFLPDASYQWWGPDDQFVVEQHPRGYARMLDTMVNDSVPTGDPRVVFDAEVSDPRMDAV